jgi:hypothetical protein
VLGGLAVLIAAVVALPVAYVGAERWVYQITIDSIAIRTTEG